MGWKSELTFRIRALFARGTMQRELDEELEFHVQREAEKYVARGLDPAEARRMAYVRFGGMDRFKEQARESWGVGPLTDLGGDLRFAARQLLRNPAFSALATLTLALGIGGTVALFSVVYGLLIRPLPIDADSRVVAFWMDYNWRGEEFDLVKDVPRSFESVAAFSNNAYTLRTDAGSSLVLATVASVELWDVLGTRPLLGRTFLPGDDRPGSEPVVVLGHGIWEREFGADPGIVGRRIDLDGVGRTVVGVMPERFYFPTPEMDLFVPLDLDPGDPSYANNGWLVLAGRLRPGADPAQVEHDLGAIATVLDERYDYSARWDKTRNPYVVPMREYLLGEVRPALLLLLAAVGLILLMACVNVTALILTRTVDRRREMSVRQALGAGRARLARQVLTESVLLGFLAGALGTGLAAALFDVLVASLPIHPAFRETLSLDWVTFAGALILSVMAGSLIALAPIRNVLRGDVGQGVLSVRQDGADGQAGRLQTVLVAAEVLLAVVLVTGASLLVRTVSQLRAIDPGVDPEGVFTADVLVSDQETSEAERALFFEALLERMSGLPGVSAAGYTNRLPLRDGGYQGSVEIHGRPDLEGMNRPNAMFRPVTAGSFAALGMELMQGRGILPSDDADAPLVAVINETFARRIWGAENPLGRTYTTGFVGSVEVVGVVKDVAISDLVGEQPMTAYYSWDQAMGGAGYGILLARTSGDPGMLVGPLRSIVRELESRAVLGRIETLEEAIEADMAEPLRLRFYLGLFSILGIVLGTVGVYGVVSYSVQRRKTEFGIRMALGAEPRLLLGEVLRTGMLPVAVGVLGGTVVAVFASRVLAGFLFGIEPVDPVSMGAAATILLVAGLSSAVIPALRASMTHPAVALRAE